jgi:hypothetical protein
LQLVDDALKSAAEVEKKVSKEVDERFEKAIESLSDYEKQYHFKETVTQTMAAAKAKDKSSLSAINTLKEKSGMKVSVPRACASFALIPTPSRTRMDGQNRQQSSTSISSNPFLTTTLQLCSVSAEPPIPLLESDSFFRGAQ